MTLSRRVWTGIAGMAVLATAFGTALAVPASAGATTRVTVADTPAGPDALSATVLSSDAGTPVATITFAPDGSAPAPAGIITCTVNVQNPHNSSHVHGTVNTISTIACTGAMSELAENVGLYFNNVLLGQLPYSNSGKPLLAGNFATPCKNGTYIGASAWLEVPPAGYYPPYSKGVAYSKIVPIIC